jgi:biopolymer transport protein ExbB
MSIFHFIRAGGFIMYPLLVLSLAALAVIAERLIAFSQMGSLAPGLLESTIELCRAQRYDEALRACREYSGPLAACLAVVIEHRGQPVARIERWVEETGQEYFIRLERMLSLLDTTTTISPLLGLLGTIIGMIGAFNAISAQQSHGNSDEVLRGVAEALYATATGITIAVVCFIAYNYFAARLRTISAETEMAATKLLNTLADGAPVGSDSKDAVESTAAGAVEDSHSEVAHAIQAAS